jgi:hypothetical protein
LKVTMKVSLWIGGHSTRLPLPHQARQARSRPDRPPRMCRLSVGVDNANPLRNGRRRVIPSRGYGAARRFS